MWHKSKQWTLAKENANLRSKNWNRTSGRRIKFSLSLSFSGSTSDIHSAASPNWDPERFDLFLARKRISPGFISHGIDWSPPSGFLQVDSGGPICSFTKGFAWSSHHKYQSIGIILPFCHQGRLKNRSLPLVSSGGFYVPEWALVLKALLHCCLKRKNKLVRIFKCLSRTCGPDFARSIPKCTQSSWRNILTSEPRKPTCEPWAGAPALPVPCARWNVVAVMAEPVPATVQPFHLLRRVPPQVARSQISTVSTFRNTAAPWTVWRWGPRSGQMVGPAPKCAATKQLGSPVSTASVASEHVINNAGCRSKDHAPIDVQTDGTQRFCSNHSYLWICWN